MDKKLPNRKRPDRKLLNRSAAAAYLGFDRRTLEDWDRRNIGPHVIRLPSGLPAYAVEDLDGFIDAHREKKGEAL